MAKKDTSFQAPCGACGGTCCGYVAIGIDSPRSVTGRENIRWFLLHDKVAVYVAHNKDWFIEFTTPCTALNNKKRCSVYERRPNVCRNYGTAHGDCEYYDTPFIEKFTTLEQFENWLAARKNRKPSAAKRAAGQPALCGSDALPQAPARRKAQKAQ